MHETSSEAARPLRYSATIRSVLSALYPIPRQEEQFLVCIGGNNHLEKIGGRICDRER